MIVDDKNVPIDEEEPDIGDGTDDEDQETLSFEGESLPEDVLLSRMESLIFVFPEPITVRRLAKLLSIDGKRVRELAGKLTEDYSNRGICLSEISGGFKFHTNPVNAPIVRDAIKIKPMRMSRAALETLAIVAYKQPATRAEIEDVRRVDSGGTLRFLFEKGLVRVLGRKEEPGRPIIYGTSDAFLEMFSLKSLSELPSLHEFTELWEEHQELVEEQDFPEPTVKAPDEEPTQPLPEPDAQPEQAPEDFDENEEFFDETPDASDETPDGFEDEPEMDDGEQDHD